MPCPAYYPESGRVLYTEGEAWRIEGSDGKVLKELERGDIHELVNAGWRAPEVFKSIGRDGKTDIWGVIIRPTNFDPSKKYAVIESILRGLK